MQFIFLKNKLQNYILCNISLKEWFVVRKKMQKKMIWTKNGHWNG